MTLGISEQNIHVEKKAKPAQGVQNTEPKQVFSFPASKTNSLLGVDFLKPENKDISLSQKMKNYIKNEEAGYKHMDKNGMYVVYYGKADKKADNLKKEEKPLLTVGHGHTGRGKITVGYRDLKEGDVISQYQAEKLLNEDIGQTRKKLSQNDGCKLDVKLPQNQSDAVISYALNVGADKLYKSDKQRDVPESMIECLNKGEKGKAQAKFNIITAGGKVQPGLAKRRIVEMVIFGNGKILPEAQETFNNNKNGLSGYKKLWHIHKIDNSLKDYGINDADRKRIISKLVY